MIQRFFLKYANRRITLPVPFDRSRLEPSRYRPLHKMRYPDPEEDAGEETTTQNDASPAIKADDLLSSVHTLTPSPRDMIGDTVFAQAESSTPFASRSCFLG